MKRKFLPDAYREVSEEALAERIKKVKEKLGPSLFILTHHYQRQEIVDLGDCRGDSFALSKKAAENRDARFIVFCGVHFMAESAAVLAREEQAVFIPELSAGCPMAAMAPLEKVERAWEELHQALKPGSAIPLTYVNSTAAVKAFCGRHGGATCTSSNADKLFAWAFNRAEKVFFLPDEHLGRNTAAKLGMDPVALWDPEKPLGGLSAEKLKAARVIVWKGFCHVHTAFTREQVERAREKHPECKVVVHPECPREVVLAADASGSTEGIINFVAKQPEGSTIVVGTEINLVSRLAREYQGVKKVLPLARSLCPNMFKINLNNLCWVLESLDKGPEAWVNRVTIPEPIKEQAALALRRMLENA